MPNPPPIKDRAAMTDHIADVMHDRYRDVSIDKLLTRPFDALQLGIAVAKRSGRISAQQARLMGKWLASVPFGVGDDRGVTGAVQEVLRTALASRKRGELNKDRY